MALVAGVDSSTQSCKVVVCDAATGEVVRLGHAAHPAGTEVRPEAWWEALQAALLEAGGLGDVAAVSVGGQQHGMVCLDEAGDVVRPALLWNDTRSADAARDLTEELGRGDDGRRAWAEAVGLVPLASFTVSKLRWLAEHEPEEAARTAAVCLPHDYLTWRLAGAPGLDALTTDRSDASGTGYWSPRDESYRRDLLTMALGHDAVVPRVLGPNEGAGHAEAGALLGPGAGDNAAAALALGAAPGDVVLSIGTSSVACAVAEQPVHDESGDVAGFADATGRFLPLVALLNGARTLDAAARLLRVDHDELARLALSAPPGAEGLTLVPYLEGERFPNRPRATGALHGLRLDTATPEHFARAIVEGMVCALTDAVDAVRALGTPIERVLLVGGAARSPAVREITSAVLGLPVTAPEPGEYVALGAARQAAWVLSGETEPPPWAVPEADSAHVEPTPGVRQRYAEVRDLVSDRPTP
jgi:xylulokinase